MKLVIFMMVLAALTDVASAVELRIYGGSGHEVFLGVLNGDKYESDSIWNSYGTHGSKYNADSIWNQYGTYGGEYSSCSPFNEYAGTPPVIVDRDGNFYGYLTVNKYHDKRAEFKLAEIVCSLWKLAVNDLDSAYAVAKEHFNPVFNTSMGRGQAGSGRIAASAGQDYVMMPKPESRIWTDHKGGTISARWVGVSEDEQKVSLVSDKTGKTILALRRKFSRGDQQFLSAAFGWYKQNGCVIYNGWWARPVARRQQRRQIGAGRILCGTELEGCKLVADDGTFLGRITWNDCATDSIFNSVGRYGSDVSSTSIWNDVSRYGSDVSQESAFNDVASSPPRIIKNGAVVGYLTTNVAKPGAISPKLLLEVLDDSADEMYRKKLVTVGF